MYIPKSKYQQNYTNGGEYITSNNAFYIGPYLELPNGKYYAGEDINSIGEELKPFNDTNNGTKIPYNRTTETFKRLNPLYCKKEIKYQNPISTKVRPTQEDYLNGSMTRYFGVRIQTGRYFEVNKETYEKIKAGKEVDKSLYATGYIKWALTGDTEKINGANLIRNEIIYPSLRTLFVNLTEYKEDDPQSDLTAKANELSYTDGTPFPEGDKYHLHPTKGPMAGAFHTNKPHAQLIFIEKQESTEQESQEIPKPQEKPKPQKRPLTKSQPRRSSPSPRGGGGY
jgi:hypothetical protein